MLQALQLTGRHGRIELELLVLRLRRRQGRRGLRRAQGVAYSGALPVRLGAAFGRGQQLCQQLVRELGVAKKNIEELAKHGAVLLAADQSGLKRRGQVLAPIQVDQQGGLLRQRNPTGIDRQASPPQRPPEGREIVRQAAAARVTEAHDASGAS